jgi:flagellar hook-length control protein FliK
MINLPIAVNNPQPPAKSASENAPARGNSKAASSGAATGTGQNDTANTQPADPFGAVLARQMQSEESNAPAPDAQIVSGTGEKAAADSALQTAKAEQDNALGATGIPADLSSALAAMLQIPQEIKTAAVAGEATAGGVSVSDLVANTAEAARIVAGPTMYREMKSDKAGINTSAALIDATRLGPKSGMPAAVSGKAGNPVITADKLQVTDRLALRADPGFESAKFSDLPGNLADTAKSVQGMAQSAASMAAPGILSNIVANEKPANSVQTVSSPLGSKGWAEEFSQKITWMGTQQNQVVELHLNPPNLGPLDVVLKISDSQATALFTSPHSAVREAVENALPRLREMLADNGITLGNTMVSDQSSRDRSADGFAGNGSAARAQRESADNAPVASPSSAAQQILPARRHNGMVDTFA